MILSLEKEIRRAGMKVNFKEVLSFLPGSFQRHMNMSIISQSSTLYR